MNRENQVKNILEFSAIFLSGDLPLIKQSTDYYREKYDKYIGYPIKIHDETSNSYLEWEKVWGKDDEINSMFLFFLAVIECYNKKVKLPPYHDEHFLLNISHSELFSLFEKYICDIDNVNDIRFSYINPIIKSEIYEKWIKENIRYFKLLRVV